MRSTGCSIIDVNIVTTNAGTVCFSTAINKLKMITGSYTVTCSASVKQIVMPILCTSRNTVYLLKDVVYFTLICLEHIWIIGTLVACMNSQLTCLNQRTTDLFKCAFCSLHQRNSHLGIVDGLAQTRSLCTKILGYLQLRRTIRRTVYF